MPKAVSLELRVFSQINRRPSSWKVPISCIGMLHTVNRENDVFLLINQSFLLINQRKSDRAESGR